MSRFGTSQSVTRREDLRLVTGRGSYMEEAAPEGAAVAVFFRSPVAHAEILGLDTRAARAMPGVIAVYTAADLAGRLVNSMDFDVVTNRDGSEGAAPVRPVLAGTHVRHVGEAIAMVVAETRAQAMDAMEAIGADLKDLPVHVETAVGGPQIHAEAPDNRAYDWAFGDEAEVAAAFDVAAHRTRLELVDNRVMGMSLEPRGAFAEWDGARLHVGFSGQGVWNLKAELAAKLGLEPAAVRVTTPDVGGGFGIKGFNYPEYLAVGFAARELGRPVFWMSTRGEAMLTDNGGRDHVTTAEAAFDDDYRLQAIRVHCVSNLGAHNSPNGQIIASELALKVLPGAYDVQKAFFRVEGVYTNTTPIDAYRGAGRPEAIYVIERLMDWSARELGLDPVELRRRNFIARGKFPYRSVSGELYDVGDFERVLDRAMAEADVAGFAARREASARAGRLRGLGLAYYIESILGDSREATRIAFTEDGMVEVMVGTQSNGQGHETVFAQFLHARAGIPYDKVRVIQGDSDRIAHGGGTGGSRSVTVQGNSINKAADTMIARFRPLAVEELEVAGADLVWEDGAFSHRRHRPGGGPDAAGGSGAGAGPARAAGHRRDLPAAGAVLSQWCPFRRGGGRSRDRRDAGGALYGGGRLRLSGEPDAGRGAGAWRRGAGDRAGGPRGGRLFARGPAPVGLVHGLRDAAGGRRAADRVLDRAGALDGQRDRHEGLRRGRHGRGAGGGDQCRPRRALGRRRAACGHAAHAAAGLGLAAGGAGGLSGFSRRRGAGPAASAPARGGSACAGYG